ncbi:hypothetical protein ACP4OV_002753 [Aristida adscensionis]
MLRAAARSVCDRLRCSDKSICSGVVELISTIGRHTDYNMKGEHVTFVELSEDAVASQINCADTLSPSLHCTGQLSSRTISNVEPINYFERGPSLVVHVPHTHRPAWGGAARISDGRLGRTRRYSGKSMSAGVESSSPPKDNKDGLTFKISKAWLAKNLTNAGVSEGGSYGPDGDNVISLHPGILVAADSVATNLFRSISSTIVISKVGSVSGNGDGKTKEKAVKESASTLLIKCANGLEAIEKYGLHIAPDLTKPGEGVGAHCTEPQGQSRTNCLYHPRLQNVGSCAASTSFQVLRWPSSQRCPPGSVIRTVPAMTSRRYCTSAPTESQQATSDLNLCLVQYTSAINIFGSGPPLLVRVPNRYHDLYKLIKYNVKIQFLVTEFGKDASYSLIECVGLLHDNGLCLPRKLTLQDMLVSSLGTFSFPELQFVKFSPKGQRDDFDCVSDILTEMMVLRHGKGAANDLPPDYEKLLSDLKDRTVHIELLRWPPALLPATVYGLGLMKLHGLLMNNLLISNFAAAETIICRLSRTAQA